MGDSWSRSAAILDRDRPFLGMRRAAPREFSPSGARFNRSVRPEDDLREGRFDRLFLRALIDRHPAMGIENQREAVFPEGALRTDQALPVLVEHVLADRG